MFCARVLGKRGRAREYPGDLAVPTGELLLLSLQPLDVVVQHLSRGRQHVLRGLLFCFQSVPVGSYYPQLRRSSQSFPSLSQSIRKGPRWRHIFEVVQCVQSKSCGLPRRRVVWICIIRTFEKDGFHRRSGLDEKKSQRPRRMYCAGQNDQLGSEARTSFSFSFFEL